MTKIRKCLVLCLCDWRMCMGFLIVLGPCVSSSYRLSDKTCPAGHYLETDHKTGHAQCLSCKPNTYVSQDSHTSDFCNHCTPEPPYGSYEVVIWPCTWTSNTKLGCRRDKGKDAFRQNGKDSGKCKPCEQCAKDEEETAACTEYTNRKCQKISYDRRSGGKTGTGNETETEKTETEKTETETQDTNVVGAGQDYNNKKGGEEEGSSFNKSTDASTPISTGNCESSTLSSTHFLILLIANIFTAKVIIILVIIVGCLVCACSKSQKEPSRSNHGPNADENKDEDGDAAMGMGLLTV